MSSGYISLKELVRETTLSRATIYRKIARGTFPAQHQLSDGRVGWALEDFEAWKADRPIHRPRPRPESP